MGPAVGPAEEPAVGPAEDVMVLRAEPNVDAADAVMEIALAIVTPKLELMILCSTTTP